MKRIFVGMGVVVALGAGTLGVRSVACGRGESVEAPSAPCGQSCESPSCAPDAASSGPEHKTACCAAGWDTTAAIGSAVAAAQGFDPVSREMVDPAAAVATRRANGLTFHFVSEDHVRTFDARPLDYLYCPVFKGSRVNPQISSERDGQTFYFCCEGCRVRFQHGDEGGDGFFGLRLALDDGGSVIRVEGVTPGTAGAQAGLEAGMTILAIDEQAIDGPDRLIAAVGGIRPGEEVALRVRTAGGEQRTLRWRPGQP